MIGMSCSRRISVDITARRVASWRSCLLRFRCFISRIYIDFGHTQPSLPFRWSHGEIRRFRDVTMMLFIWFLRWIRWFSVFRFASNVLVINEFGSRTSHLFSKANICLIDGKEVLFRVHVTYVHRRLFFSLPFSYFGWKISRLTNGIDNWLLENETKTFGRLA